MNEEIKAVTQKQQNTTVEQRFQDLGKKTNSEQWNSASYLQNLAKEIKNTDEALAKRILVRVDNLNKLPQKHLTNNLPSAVKTEPSKQKNIPLSYRIEKSTVKKFTKSGLFWLVLLPSFFFALYQLCYAAKRYESRAQLIVQQPDGMATMDASMALLSGFGISSSTASDAQLVKTYIHSKDMLDYLVTELNITEHYSKENKDVISRLKKDHTQEDLLDYYQKMVSVDIDNESSVILVSAQAYTPDYAQKLTRAIVKRAEWYINQIGNNLAEHQLDFIRSEHVKVEEKLSATKNTLLSFQEKYNLLDPEAEGMALQQITYGIEAKIAEKQSELNALTGIMSNKAPQVKAVKNEIRALEDQLNKERVRLSRTNVNAKNTDQGAELSIGAILAKYAELKIGLELALKSFTSSEISLEKARIETYRKLKYLVVVESPTLPEDNQYPKAPYNITLFTLLLFMLFGISHLLIATVREIK